MVDITKLYPTVPSPESVKNAGKSVVRQFDNTPGGGFADLGQSGESNDSIFGSGPDNEAYNRYLQGDTVRTLYDTVFEYDGTLNGMEDTADFWGPSVGDVGDVAVDVEGEQTGPDELRTKLFLGALVGIVVLWFIRPLLAIAAEGLED